MNSMSAKANLNLLLAVTALMASGLIGWTGIKKTARLGYLPLGDLGSFTLTGLVSNRQNTVIV